MHFTKPYGGSVYFLLISTLFGLLLSRCVYADEAKNIQDALTGSFQQSKTLKPLKRPFISMGNFVYLPRQGLLWQTASPIFSAKLFAHNGVFTLLEKGIKIKEANVDNAFFLALFSMNIKQLDQYFSFKKTSSELHNRCLWLVPKSDALSHLFNQINLCVAKHESIDTPGIMPKTITLFEVNNNTTEITLILSPQPASQQELSYFD